MKKVGYIFGKVVDGIVGLLWTIVAAIVALIAIPFLITELSTNKTDTL